MADEGASKLPSSAGAPSCGPGFAFAAPGDLMDQFTAELEFEFLRRYGRSGGGR
jgi:hypothetical protein